MTTYIYPQNLRAKANLWLWSLRDFLIMGIAALLSVVILVQTHIFLPAAATLLYGFLSIIIFVQKLEIRNLRLLKGTLHLNPVALKLQLRGCLLAPRRHVRLLLRVLIGQLGLP